MPERLSLSFYLNFGGTSTKAKLEGGKGGNAQWTSSTPEVFNQSSTKLGFLRTEAGRVMLGYAETRSHSCGPNTQINQFLGRTQPAQVIAGMGSTATGFFVYLVTGKLEYPISNCQSFYFQDN